MDIPYHLGKSHKQRTIALRRGSGRFLAEPQAAYDFLADELRKKQVDVPALFWCRDERLKLCCNKAITNSGSVAFHTPYHKYSVSEGTC